jgi:hypothetical protein
MYQRFNSSNVEWRVHWALASILVISSFPGPVGADILWRGDYETGNFMQWVNSDGDAPNLSGMPNYCRPVGPTAYYGDGTCLELVTNIARAGSYAAKFTIKNSQNALGEPEDCGGLPDCTRRKVELKSWNALESANKTTMPYMSERWMSVSHFVPGDWSNAGSGWGPIVFQVKPYVNNSGVSPAFSILLENGHWEIRHRWSDVVHVNGQLPWQQQMFYNPSYPAANGSDSGADLRADFPNQAASQQALASVLRNGWTDWIVHVKWDARGQSAGGTGFLELYKREGNGTWVQVLNIRPRIISRGSMTFDRGIAYNEPPRSGPYNSFGDHGGFAIIAGMYLEKGQVWNLPANRVIYNDNIKIGDERSNLAEMAPENGTIGETLVPAPPSNLVSE